MTNKIAFNIGDKVKVTGYGPFEGNNGVVVGYDWRFGGSEVDLYLVYVEGNTTGHKGFGYRQENQKGWLDKANGSAYYYGERELSLVPQKTRKAERKSLTPQAHRVLSLLKEKGSVTAIECQGVLKVRSLSRRITELKDAGHKVLAKHSKDITGQRYVRYYLHTGEAERMVA